MQYNSTAYYEEFEKTKIIYPDISKTPQFTLDHNNHYLANTLYCIPEQTEYLLGILNSSVIEFFYSQIAPQIQNGYFRFISQYMRQLPIPNASKEQRHELEKTVKQLLETRKKRSEIKSLERDLNLIVYQIYDLHEKDIRLIERTLNKEAIIKADSALSELTDLEGDF